MTPIKSRLHDGGVTDWVYGLDAAGLYLGVVTRGEAAGEAPQPPPSLGTWRWHQGAWVRHVPIERRLVEIDRVRAEEIAAGVEWEGRRWHADIGFQQVLQSYLTAFVVGLLAPDATVTVRGVGNEMVQLGRADLEALAAAVMAHVDQAFRRAWSAKDAARGWPSP